MRKRYDFQVRAAVDEVGRLEDVSANILPGKDVGKINDRELKSINDLITYVGFNTGCSYDLLRAIVCAEFDVLCVEDIPADQYEVIVEWLVDVKPMLHLN